jgi:hypothetical protein
MTGTKSSHSLIVSFGINEKQWWAEKQMVDARQPILMTRGSTRLGSLLIVLNHHCQTRLEKKVSHPAGGQSCAGFATDVVGLSMPLPTVTQRKGVIMSIIAPVVGINIYSVPKGMEEPFIQWWYGMRQRLISGKGFVAGHLHRNLDENAAFNFVNVAEWENDLYSSLYKENVDQMKIEVSKFGAEMTPGLFAVVSNY